MEGNEAFYYLHKDGKLMGAVITHVDDFSLAGTNICVDQFLKFINLRFMGWYHLQRVSTLVRFLHHSPFWIRSWCSYTIVVPDSELPCLELPSS